MDAPRPLRAHAGGQSRMDHPPVDGVLVALGSPTPGPLHRPAQPVAQQRPHAGGMVAHPGQPFDHHSGPPQGPQLAGEPVGRGTLEQGLLDLAKPGAGGPWRRAAGSLPRRPSVPLAFKRACRHSRPGRRRRAGGRPRPGGRRQRRTRPRGAGGPQSVRVVVAPQGGEKQLACLRSAPAEQPSSYFGPERPQPDTQVPLDALEPVSSSPRSHHPFKYHTLTIATGQCR